MSAWWTGLAPRERVLIAIAGALLALVIVWQFILVPARTARADAQVQLETTSRTLTRLQESYMQQRAAGGLPLLNQNGQTISAEAFKTQVTRAATDKGLSIARLQGRDGATIGLVFERADPRLIFFWLEEVETNLGGQVSRLTMERVDGGSVRVSVDIEGAPS